MTIVEPERYLEWYRAELAAQLGISERSLYRRLKALEAAEGLRSEV